MTYTKPIFFVLFLPIVIILYNLFPQKHRWKVLLLASYAFFWSISGKLLIYLLVTTGLMYVCGLWLNKKQNERNEELKNAEKAQKKIIKQKYVKKQRKILVLNALILLGMLIVLKYSKFFGTNINSLFGLMNLPIQIPIPHFIMPIGISFYTLQAISYIIDVYKEKIKADKNIGRLALFISFFPQIMEGPICRYEETANSLFEGKKTSYKNLTFGIQRILFGLMKKTIIVDRVNPLILEIFNNYSNYDGGIMAVGMVLYTLQLYMDFSGVMDIVIGTAEIFGVKMPENFRQPFFSKTIAEFWTRWHITLGAWFRDYIYYPVCLTDKCKKLTAWGRKKIGNYYGPLLASSIALFCVWICNGLWHGSAWSYIFFGMYHFVLILLGRIIEPLVKKINTKLHIDNKKLWYRLIQIIRTTILVFIGELFFRANGLKAGLEMFGKMITNFSFEQIQNGTVLNLGIDLHDFIIMGVMVVVITIISLLKEKGINIRESISKKNVVLRWSLYYTLIIAIIVFGSYGLGIVPLDPMYANF